MHTPHRPRRFKNWITFLASRSAYLRAASGLTLAFAVMAVGISCTSKSEKVASGDEIARANYLIEEHQTSEAIYILGERLKREPRDGKARVLLASAYASRAGLELGKYKDFAAELMKWDRTEDLWPDNARGDVLTAVAKAAWQIQIVIRAFDAIPQPGTPEALDDLTSALQVLDDGGELSGGPSLYRALLRVALFKYSLTTDNALKNVQGCQVEAHEMLRWLSTVETDLLKIVDDVAGGLGDPEAKERLHGIADGLQSGVDQALAAMKPAARSGVPVETWMQIPGALKKVTGACK